MITVPYDAGRFDPPAPVVPLQVKVHGSDEFLQLAGLVDSGADLTVFPEDVAERYLPVAGTVGVRGVTGDVQDAVLFRAEVSIGDRTHVLIVAGFGQEVILGRNLLSHLIVRLDGPARETTITQPE